MALSRRFLQTIKDRCPPPAQELLWGCTTLSQKQLFLVSCPNLSCLHLSAPARTFCPTRDQLQHRDLRVLLPAGTIYLWIFWPSFTSAATVPENAENWAVLNTYFSLVASVAATFILSPVLYEESTPWMVGPPPGQTRASCPAHIPACGAAEPGHTQGKKGMPISPS